MFRRIVVSFIATKNYTKVTRPVVSLKPIIVARPFHIKPPYRSSCDFGSPCECSECRGAARRPFCDICHVRPTVNQSSEWTRDRKGISSYSFTSFCGQCWERYIERRKKREDEEEQLLASRKKRVDNMLQHVRALEPAEQVPIRYAVEKLLSDIRSVRNSSNSQQWHQRDIIKNLSQDLQIVKVRNRYICDKRRVDAMDFKLWHFYKRLDVDV